uniref:Uncharacterized protein n=1 Tax=Sphaerodactylus townsendi TaxID=933632 RepID=A0ACB8E905_9SAUR
MKTPTSGQTNHACLEDVDEEEVEVQGTCQEAGLQDVPKFGPATRPPPDQLAEQIVDDRPRLVAELSPATWLTQKRKYCMSMLNDELKEC